MRITNIKRVAGSTLLASALGLLAACGGEEPTQPAPSTPTTPGGSTTSPTQPTTPEPIAPKLVYAINSGGSATTYNGVNYQADAYVTGGGSYTADGDISGTNEDALFQSERYNHPDQGNIVYSLPVGNGTYTIYLHFAEVYQDATGARVFSVSAENQTVVSNLDIIASAGKNSPMTREVANISVTDGSLDIALTSVVDNAKISGLAVYATQVVLTTADKGKQYWDDLKCSSCHDVKLKGLVQDGNGKPLTLSQISSSINASMPILEPGSCVGECADYTAAYVKSANPFFGREPVQGAPEPTAGIDPFPTIMSRLNKNEYNNTVRDLLNDNSKPADKFPSDITGRFSNDSQPLFLTKENIDGYYETSRTLATGAVQAGSRVLGCNPSDQSCADNILNNFATKAWRRPLADDEKRRLKSLYESAYSSTNNRSSAITTMVRALLLSPNFIFRPEIDDNLNSNQGRDLSPYELASRLSYFLWASMPDDQLFAKAANNSLTNENVLKAEVARMLNDPKSQTLIDIYVEEWLAIVGSLEKHPADPKTFPNYTKTLEANLIQETLKTIEYIIDNNRPLSDLVKGRYTFLNGPVANHYGINGYSGETFRKHDWNDNSPRRGIIGQAAVLAGHAHGTKTSPVLRGFWVMDKLLCDSPPFPNDDVVSLFPKLPEGLNPRVFSEEHSESNPVCYSCHAFIDPIGYGLEGFDPIGRWRDTYPNGDAVDTSSVLPTGEIFSDLPELGSILANKPEFAICSIQWTMSYALGRELDLFSASAQDRTSARDYAAVHSVYKKTLESDHAILDVITEIVLSPAFRQRRGANSQ